jgi:tetratricopeptide (TPR) repeat protein
MRCLLLGCLWYYGSSLNSQPITVNEGPPASYIARLTRHDHDARKVPPGPLKPDADYKYRSDYAVAMVLQGKYPLAIELLEGIEKEKPGEYIVAANLGTSYELSGDNVKARRWIEEALKRNPDSHYGTEWLHLRILDAKMALEKDPAWLASNSVLGVDFGSAPKPEAPFRWPDGLNGAKAMMALNFQLHERLGFVKPPDPLVAGLLFDLGNLLATQLTAEHGLAVYDLAATYKPATAELLEARRAFMRKASEQGAAERTRKRLWNRGVYIGVWVLATVLACFGVIYGLRRAGGLP